MTTINSTSPASIWVQPQTLNTESPQQVVQTGIETSSASVLVNISDAALAMLNSETAALGNGNGNDPPADSDAGTQGNGNGNEPPFPPVTKE